MRQPGSTARCSPPRWGGAGRPRVFAVDPTLAFRDFQLLKLKYDKLLSNYAFKCKLRHYTSDEAFDAYLLETGQTPEVGSTAQLAPKGLKALAFRSQIL